MKKVINIFMLLSIIAAFVSCEKDSGKLPNISFKTGGNYISTNTTIAAGSAILIGIDASKSEDADVLKKINVSKSINGGTATTVYTKDLSGTEGDTYSYDYNETLANNISETDTYTFTVTNRDGLVNQVSLTITIEKLPAISFKTGPIYISSDVGLAPTSVIVIGINAVKSSDTEVLKKFTVSKSINGGTATTVFSQDLSGASGDSYSHDYTEVLAGTPGDKIKYTFTVTNKDGLTNQLTITVTVT